MKTHPILRTAALAVFFPSALLATYSSDNADLKFAAPANPALPSLFLVGDSTSGRAMLLNLPALENRRQNPTIGWGFPLTDYFDLDKINVVLRSDASMSTRTYLTKGRWANVLPEIKAGDIVMLQFGQFERAPVDDPHNVVGGPLPGLGEETQLVGAMPQETVHTYGWYMRKYIADIRSKGAVPIVLSPSVRNVWKEGRVDRGPKGVRNWAAEVARSQHTAFVDVTNIEADRYQSLGQATVKTFFYNEAVHTNLDGARVNAALVVSGLKALSNPPLAKYLSPKGQHLPPASPAYAIAVEP
jgi:hypothetical protein